MDTKPTRIVFLDFLKTICLFGVILGHLCTWEIHDIAPGTAAWNVSNAYNTICRVSVPVFLMISGYLVLEENACRRKMPKSLASAGRFLLIYLVWSAVYALPSWRDLLASPGSLIPTLARGEFHLWYLIMLAGVYLVLPLLYRITRTPEDADRALAVMFVSTILLPSLTGLPGLGWLSDLLGSLYLDTGFLFYVLAGYRLRCRPLGTRARRLLYAAGVASTIWGGAATWYLSCQSGSFSDFWLDQRSLTVALGAGALFVWVQQHVSHLPRWVEKAAGSVSRCSLGIYLVHVLFLLLLRKFGISVYALPPVFWLPLLAVGVLLLSLALTALLRRFPLVRRFV